MKKISKIFTYSIILILWLFAFSQNGLFWLSGVAFAGEKIQKNQIKISLEDEQDGNKDIKDQKPKPRENNTGSIIENNQEKAKLVKNLNTLLVEAYKIKIDLILDNLKENIKNNSVENQIKALTMVLIPINSKLKLIESKEDISPNRKEILVLVLKHIKTNLDTEVNDLLENK